MISKRTKKYKTLNIIFTILHFLCLIGPLLYFIPYAFIVGEVTTKVILGLSTATSIILAAISLFVAVKHRAGLHRSILWLLILGILTALTSVKPFICIMAVASILDELVFTPIKTASAQKAKINKEIDLRSEG